MDWQPILLSAELAFVTTAAPAGAGYACGLSSCFLQVQGALARRGGLRSADSASSNGA